MNCFKFILVLIISLFTGCKKDCLPCIEKLDKDVLEYNSLYQFNDFMKSKKSINNIIVCDPSNKSCDGSEISYHKILEENNIEIEDFHEIIKKMGELNLITYFRYKHYTLWVKNGGMGEIRGYLINHDSLKESIESFRLNDQYYIEIGRNIRDNIYFFRGN